MRRPSALWQLTSCRMKEFLREPEAIFWVFAFPMLLSIALGLAFREKAPDRIPVGVAAAPQAQRPQDAERAAAVLNRSPALRARVMAPEEGREALRTGRISLLVEIPVPARPGAAPVFRFDETRPDSRIARLEAGDALERAAGRRDVLGLRTALVTDKGSRYIDFLIPGLLGMNLMGTGIWSLAFSITMARNRKVLKRLIATPMRKSEYLLSQILARLGFLVIEVVVLVGFGWIVFGVAVRGSLVTMAATCVVGAMSFCGLGLLIGSRVSTIEGASGLANLVMVPMWICSGTFFSAERFPDSIQPLIRALPLTALNEALRGVMTEAGTLAEIAPRLGIVAGWGIASFAAALKIFRWR